jgi:FkbM family methyltransferase
MSTPRIQYNPVVLKDIVKRGLLNDDPFMLFDIGASGGIEQYWQSWGYVLHAVGFEPLKKEVDRLNRESVTTNVRYVDAFVGAENFDQILPSILATDTHKGWLPKVYERASSTLAQQIANYSFTQRFNNDDPEIVFSDRRTSIDTFCKEEDLKNVDFIKIDTDGHDYEVIVGAKDTLRNRKVLGLFVECQLHGIIHEHANVFSNIDRILREAGFSLFDFEIYRYTRGALPGQFLYDIFAQTKEGQVIWGDALYLRDYAAAGYASRWDELSTSKLLKLTGLYELFGLYDCAAELLLHIEKKSKGEDLPIKDWLDALAREIRPEVSDYQDLSNRFQKNPADFFPSSSARRTLRKVSLLRRLKQQLFG